MKSFFTSTNDIGQHIMGCMTNPTNYQLGLGQLTDFVSETQNVSYKTNSFMHFLFIVVGW